MKQDKFLTGILIGIGVLIIGAVTMFFIRQSTIDYKSEDTPNGVVHNFILAIEREDYEKAYGYMLEGEGKPTFVEFRQHFSNGRAYQSDVGVTILETDIYNNHEGQQEAIVELSISYHNSDPFSGGYSSSNTATLSFVDDVWKISMMPYEYWSWDWYNNDEY